MIAAPAHWRNRAAEAVTAVMHAVLEPSEAVICKSMWAWFDGSYIGSKLPVEECSYRSR